MILAFFIKYLCNFELVIVACLHCLRRSTITLALRCILHVIPCIMFIIGRCAMLMKHASLFYHVSACMGVKIEEK